MVLTLDAATAVCGVGLVEDDALVDHLEADEVSALPGLAARLLAQHRPAVSQVAVTVGPGGFSGLRAAIALAQGIALARAVPVVGVTLGDALADGSGANWTVVDNKRGGLLLERDGTIETVTEAALPLPSGPVRIAGDAAGTAVRSLAARGATVTAGPLRPDPLGIAAAARARPRAALPIYVDPPAARPGPAPRPAPA